MKSPAVQKLIKGGYEFLTLNDPVDEFCLQNVYEYEKKPLLNVGKGTFKLPNATNDKTAKRLKKHYQPLTDWWKNLLKDKLDKVEISERLTDDPCIVVASVFGYTSTMTKVSKAQAYGPDNPMANAKKNLEINPSHPLIKELAQRVQNNPDKETEEMATLLFEAALLNSGYNLPDPREFSNRFFKIFNPAMGISKDAQIEDVVLPSDDDDVDDVAEPEKKDQPDLKRLSSPTGKFTTESVDASRMTVRFSDPEAEKAEEEQRAAARAAKEAEQKKGEEL